MDLPRSSGLLLHITSLPSRYGIGDLGPGAYRFVDYLEEAGQRVWQVLPLVPVSLGHSPYSSPSTFAGNPLLISPDVLTEEDLLHPDDVVEPPDFPEHVVDYARAIPYKLALLRKAYDRFAAGDGLIDRGAFNQFRADNADWLEDYALFMALKDAHDGAHWTEWPTAEAQRSDEGLTEARTRHAEAVRMHAFWQYLFHRQWDALHAYCRERSIRVFGDIPIYVSHDSADVWANPDLFFLDDAGNPTVVAGVPPDYFSETGQRWGNPLYRWDLMKDRDYAWWTKRLAHAFSLFDIVRLDHFRGFAGYWEIPATEETAVHGRWVPGPGADFFQRIREKLGDLPIVAENLGIITPDVTELMNAFALPGMAVLQFAFDSDVNSTFLPHNYERNLVAYTGTHDNDTLVGWWMNMASTLDADTRRRTRTFAKLYLGLEEDDLQRIHWHAARSLLGSVATLVVLPMQDVLGLGSRARMNTPGDSEGNWTWRCRPDQLAHDDATRLRTLSRAYGRTDDCSIPV